MTLPLWCIEPPSAGMGDLERVQHRLRAVAAGPPDATGHAEAGAGETPGGAEREVVERIRAGDVEAFEAVYRGAYVPLLRFAFRLVRSHDAAKDVVQDVFLSVWVRRGELSVRDTVRAYLYGAVRQRALRALRHQRVVDRTATAVAAVDAPPPGMGGADAAPDASAERRAVAEALRGAIATLPERQRMAAELYLDADLSPVEIAAALGVSAVAVRKLLAKAAERLREVLPRG